jgi:hypothetical protein
MRRTESSTSLPVGWSSIENANTEPHSNLPNNSRDVEASLTVQFMVNVNVTMEIVMRIQSSSLTCLWWKFIWNIWMRSDVRTTRIKCNARFVTLHYVSIVMQMPVVDCDVILVHFITCDPYEVELLRRNPAFMLHPIRATCATKPFHDTVRSAYNDTHTNCSSLLLLPPTLA